MFFHTPATRDAPPDFKPPHRRFRGCSQREAAPLGRLRLFRMTAPGRFLRRGRADPLLAAAGGTQGVAEVMTVLHALVRFCHSEGISPKGSPHTSSYGQVHAKMPFLARRTRRRNVHCLPEYGKLFRAVKGGNVLRRKVPDGRRIRPLSGRVHSLPEQRENFFQIKRNEPGTIPNSFPYNLIIFCPIFGVHFTRQARPIITTRVFPAPEESAPVDCTPSESNTWRTP